MKYSQSEDYTIKKTQPKLDITITPKKEDKLRGNVISSPLMGSAMKVLHLCHDESDLEPASAVQHDHHFNYRPYDSPSRLLDLRSPEKMLSNIILFPHGRD